MALNYVTLTGNIPGGAGAVATFTPSNWLTDSSDDFLFPPAPVTEYVNGAGKFSVSLLATDNVAPLPSGWSWTVAITGIPGVPLYTFSFFLAFATGATQDISTLAPLASTPVLKSFTPPGRPATIVVAASNSSAAWRNAADFVAAGTHDDVTLLAAQAAMPPQGGTILLSDGTFTVSNPYVPTKNNVKLKGQGPNATIIQAAIGANCNGFQFDVSQAISLIFNSIEGITFFGNYNSGTGNSTGFGCHINYSLSFTFWDFFLRDVWFDNWAQDGFYSTGGHGYVLDHVLGEFCNGNGLTFAGGFIDSPPRIVNGTFKSNNSFGVSVSTIDAFIGHNEISVNGGAYGLVAAATGIKVVGNQIRANTQSGAHITGGAEGLEIIGNSIENNGQHGLLLDDANCTVDGNFFNGNSITTSNTYDEIHIQRGTFNASGNFLTGNVIDGASQSRYGINLADSGCTSTVLTANRIINEVTAPTATLADTIILASGNFTIGPAFLCPPNIYAPASQTTKTVSSTTMAAFFSTSINTGSFVAPSSGIAIVGLSCAVQATLSTFIAIGLAAHGTVTPLVCDSVVFETWTSDIIPLKLNFYVTGLTPGTSYNFDVLGAASTGSVVIYAIGTTSTTPTLSGSGVGAPVVMTVLGQ